MSINVSIDVLNIDLILFWACRYDYAPELINSQQNWSYQFQQLRL